MGRYFCAMCIALAAMMSAPSFAEERPSTLVGEGAVVVDDGGEVDLTVELTRPVGWRLWLEDGPPRIVVELSDVEWTETPELKSTSVQSFEVIETAPTRTELHAVLREPLSILSAEMKRAQDGTARLHVQLQPTTAEAFQSDLEGDGVAARRSDRPMIAIDPGHGGRDPGAEFAGIREADLVLEFAHRLRDTLLASGKFDVVLTRSDDSFLSLDERLTRAREAGADVLLSLHADALADADAASGIVLYRLAESAHAAANLRLLERHSPDDQITGMDFSQTGEDVTLTLLDLARQRTVPRTKSLSAALLSALKGKGLVVNSRPERTENFAVLKAADMPSLLIELGFLSTEADLKRMTSKKWQRVAAGGIRNGLILWTEEEQFQ
ncbi:MAG: N-acetylmuramoyl-L-alanine amidase [Pseudomonadota bacterium]